MSGLPQQRLIAIAEQAAYAKQRGLYEGHLLEEVLKELERVKNDLFDARIEAHKTEDLLSVLRRKCQQAIKEPTTTGTVEAFDGERWVAMLDPRDVLAIVGER